MQTHCEPGREAGLQQSRLTAGLQSPAPHQAFSHPGSHCLGANCYWSSQPTFLSHSAAAATHYSATSPSPCTAQSAFHFPPLRWQQTPATSVPKEALQKLGIKYSTEAKLVKPRFRRQLAPTPRMTSAGWLVDFRTLTTN